MILLGLGLYFSLGDRPQHKNWRASEAGEAFMTQSSEAWADASIASGSDETAARAAAKRITAMYTGGA